MIKSIFHKSILPNTDGFRFWAVMADGTILEDVVTKGEDGIHRCATFKKMIGWLRIPAGH